MWAGWCCQGSSLGFVQARETQTWGGLSGQCRLVFSLSDSVPLVGRPPWAAAGPLAGLCWRFLEAPKPARGPAAAQGGRPTKN